jgi:hypothetical protein
MLLPLPPRGVSRPAEWQWPREVPTNLSKTCDALKATQRGSDNKKMPIATNPPNGYRQASTHRPRALRAGPTRSQIADARGKFCLAVMPKMRQSVK